ncbi:MAG: protein kinase [Candidatus Cloacimonetes bacterium]|nr:protein kinase [Candidatus Cloacimonadota bacterium]
MHSESVTIPECYLDEFRPVEFLAVGGQSHIHIVEDKKSRQLVVLKIYNDSGNRAAAIFKLVSGLKHPCVLKPLRYFDYTPKAMLLPLIRGGTLQQKIQKKRLSFEESGVILAQLVSLLSSFSEIGLVHRDLKPDNLYLNSELHCFVADFDFAHVSQGMFRDWLLPLRYRTQGTTYFMAPEHLEGGIPHSGMDDYAVATLYYQCLTLNLPFGNSIEDRFDVKRYRPAPILTRAQNRILQQALHHKPRQRICARKVYEALYLG